MSSNPPSTHSVQLRNAWKHVVLLLCLCAALWFWTAGFWDLWGPDEGRYVQIAKELLHSGDWRLLTLAGQPYSEKPPLPFWILAGVLKLTHGQVSSWALRLPSVLLATMTVVLCYLMGRRLFNARAGLIAALALLTSAQFIEDAPTTEINMMFTGWIALSLFAWLTRPSDKTLSWPRAAVLWGALAGAFFTKGPLAILIVLSVIGAEAAMARSWRLAAASRPGAGLCFLAALIGCWFCAQMQAAGKEFVTAQAKSETVQRFLYGSHEAPFWFYLPRLFSSIFVPWGLALIPASVRLWKSRRSLPQGIRPVLGWILIPFLILCLAHGKRESYLLPVLPGMALAVGWYLDQLLGEARAFPRFSRGFGVVLISVGFLLAVSAVVLAFRPDLVWRLEFFVLDPGLVMLGVGGLLAAVIGAWLIRRRQSGFAPIAALSGFVFVAALVNFATVNPALNPAKSTRAFSRTLEGLIREYGLAPQVAGLGSKAARPEYHVYGGYQVVPLDTHEAFAPDGSGPAIVVARPSGRTELRDLAQAAGYRLVYQGLVSKDPLLVYARVNGPPAPIVQEPIRIALIGDTAHEPEDAAKVVQQIARAHDAAPISAVFLLGDNLDDKGPFSEVVAEQFEGPFAPILDRRIPIYAILGNHDVSSGQAEEELNYPAFNMHGRSYYAQSFGGDGWQDGSTSQTLATFFLLDSPRLLHEPEQILWFRDALDNCDSIWKILLLHHPFVASRISHSSSPAHYRAIMPVIMRGFDVDVVATGHNHLYERRKITHGVLFLTAGNGSRDIDDPLPPDPGRAAGTTELRGFVLLTISRGLIELEAIGEHGEILDQAAFKDQEAPPGMIETPPSAESTLP